MHALSLGQMMPPGDAMMHDVNANFMPLQTAWVTGLTKVLIAITLPGYGHLQRAQLTGLAGKGANRRYSSGLKCLQHLSKRPAKMACGETFAAWERKDAALQICRTEMGSVPADKE